MTFCFIRLNDETVLQVFRAFVSLRLGVFHVLHMFCLFRVLRMFPVSANRAAEAEPHLDALRVRCSCCGPKETVLAAPSETLTETVCPDAGDESLLTLGFRVRA